MTKRPLADAIDEIAADGGISKAEAAELKSLAAGPAASDVVQSADGRRHPRTLAEAFVVLKTDLVADGAILARAGQVVGGAVDAIARLDAAFVLREATDSDLEIADPAIVILR